MCLRSFEADGDDWKAKLFSKEGYVGIFRSCVLTELLAKRSDRDVRLGQHARADGYALA